MYIIYSKLKSKFTYVYVQTALDIARLDWILFQSPNPVALEPFWNRHVLKKTHLPWRKINWRLTIFHQWKIFEDVLKQFLAGWLILLQGPLWLSRGSCSRFKFTTIVCRTCLGVLALRYIKPKMTEKMHITRLRGFKEMSETGSFKSSMNSKMILSDTVCFHICEGHLRISNYLMWSIFSPVNTWCVSNWKILSILPMPHLVM